MWGNTCTCGALGCARVCGVSAQAAQVGMYQQHTTIGTRGSTRRTQHARAASHPDVALAVLVDGRSKLALGGRGRRLLRAQLDLGDHGRPRADDECVGVRGHQHNEQHAKHGAHFLSKMCDLGKSLGKGGAIARWFDPGFAATRSAVCKRCFHTAGLRAFFTLHLGSRLELRQDGLGRGAAAAGRRRAARS